MNGNRCAAVVLLVPGGAHVWRCGSAASSASGRLSGSALHVASGGEEWGGCREEPRFSVFRGDHEAVYCSLPFLLQALGFTKRRLELSTRRELLKTQSFIL